jgi:amidase
MSSIEPPTPRVPSPAERPRALDLAYAGIVRQRELLRAGVVSSRELVEIYLDRIEQLDARLNAFRVVFADEARQTADTADRKRADGDERPLLGVPIAVKDDFAVAGHVTAFGTAAFTAVATADSTAVAALRKAGAVILGVTHMPELAQWPFTESQTHGSSRNPWAEDRTPGGSSGGAAVAVGAGLVAGALGSDGAGSIRIPAACCGLVGFKPSRSRVSYAPLSGHWYGLTAAGPITRRVVDAAAIVDAVTAHGGSDDGPLSSLMDCCQAATQAPPPLRIAVSEKLPPPLRAKLDPAHRGALDRTAELLGRLGHRVSEADPPYGAVALNLIARYLRGIHDDVARATDPGGLERRTRGMGRIGGLVPRGRAVAAARAAGRHRERLRAYFADHDLLITPTLARPAVEVGRWAGYGALRTFNAVASFAPFTGVWNVTDQPALALPVGLSEIGLPLSVQIVGRPGDDTTLVSLAAQLEHELKWERERPPVDCGRPTQAR